MLYDMNGRTVVSQTVEGNVAQINLSQLASGSYVLRLIENGKSSAGIKIVKQ